MSVYYDKCERLAKVTDEREKALQEWRVLFVATAKLSDPGSELIEKRNLARARFEKANDKFELALEDYRQYLEESI